LAVTGTIHRRPRGARPAHDRYVVRRARAVTARYAVFGRPVAHSLSPRIHAMFAAQCGIALDYRAIEAGRETFADMLDAFARDGGCGANLTLPLKETGAGVCATLTDRARRCGSVNTLARVADAWHGDSTDGAGFLRDLTHRHGFDPRGTRVLLLGAGGAARAVAFTLQDAGVAELVVANRTEARAAALATALGESATASAWTDLRNAGDFDLVVNATAAGHGAGPVEWPNGATAAQAFCYDLSYRNTAQPFLDWAARAGAARASDGLGMLVEQAAESFLLWEGIRPDTAPVHAMLDT
jgi:shikimate dehydrogenase